MRPSSETLHQIIRTLEPLGIYPDHTMAEIIVAAYDEVLFHTPTGRNLLAARMNMSIEDGDSDMQYEIPDTRELLNGKDVKLLSTFFINGRFVKPSQVDTYHMDRNSCDSCMGEYHCSKPIRDEYGKETQMCNHCRNISEVARIRDTANDCGSCSVKSCKNHPENLTWIREAM